MKQVAVQPAVDVTVIAHSCVLVQAGEVGLLADPWLSGTIFNDSWTPMFPTTLRANELAALTHVWISHEHPDHLHFPSLRAIPAEVRARVILLYQHHPQRAVVDALRKLGFKEVVELMPGRWHRLSASTSVACYPSRRIDSALALRAGDVTVLNINDCKFGDCSLRQLRRELGTIDLLLSQYSIAGWIANSSQAPTEERFKVIRRTARFCHALRPRALALFASHAWFCHEENAHMNDWALPPREALEWLAAHGHAALPMRALMPRQCWSARSGFDDVAPSLQPYAQAVVALRAAPDVRAGVIQIGEIKVAVKRYFEGLRDASLPSAPAQPLRLYVEDLRMALEMRVDLHRLDIVELERTECDIALGSQALLNCFQFRWGFDTLDTSGRYELLRPPKDHPVLLHCYAYGSAFKVRNGFTWRERLQHRLARRGETFDRLLKVWRNRGQGNVPLADILRQANLPPA